MHSWFEPWRLWLDATKVVFFWEMGKRGRVVFVWMVMDWQGGRVDEVDGEWTVWMMVGRGGCCIFAGVNFQFCFTFYFDYHEEIICVDGGGGDGRHGECPGWLQGVYQRYDGRPVGGLELDALQQGV